MTKKKDLTQQEKLTQAQEGLRVFANQFGPNDLIKEAFFDVLLETIYDPEEATRDGLSVPSTEEQEIGTNPEQSRAGEMPTYKIE
jgi:hypothetical protein